MSIKYLDNKSLMAWIRVGRDTNYILLGISNLNVETYKLEGISLPDDIVPCNSLTYSTSY